jgi:hypothetical protein
MRSKTVPNLDPYPIPQPEDPVPRPEDPLPEPDVPTPGPA